MHTGKWWVCQRKKNIATEHGRNLTAGLSKVDVIVQESLGAAMQPSV